mgnify:CR=1 FL=1
METILVSLIAIVMLVLSTLFMVTTTMNSTENISSSLQNIDTQATNIQMTAIDVSFESLDEDSIILSVRNNGQKNLVDFGQWDILAQSQNSLPIRLAFSPAGEPEAGQWAIDGIYLPNGAIEVFDLGILNPQEYMTVLIKLGAPLQANEVIRITIATENGVTSQCLVIG